MEQSPEVDPKVLLQWAGALLIRDIARTKIGEERVGGSIALAGGNLEVNLGENTVILSMGPDDEGQSFPLDAVNHAIDELYPSLSQDLQDTDVQPQYYSEEDPTVR